MSTTTIVPQDRDALCERIAHEIEALALEIFSTTYGVGWQEAITAAVNALPELVDVADDWDHTALVAQRQQREIDLMRATGCDAATAIDAVRVADGKLPWAETMAEFDPDAGDDGDPNRDYLAERYSSGFSATRRRMYEEV